MSDLLAITKFKNRKLYEAVQRFGGTRMVSEASGVALSDIYGLMSMRLMPITRSGRYTTAAQKLANFFFDTPLAELFPLQIYALDLPTEVIHAVNSQTMSLPEARKQRLLPSATTLKSSLEEFQWNAERRSRIESMLRTLTPREELVVRALYGLDDGHRNTLQDVANRLNVTVERVRQVERRALRSMRHPSRSRALRPLMEGTVD